MNPPIRTLPAAAAPVSATRRRPTAPTAPTAPTGPTTLTTMTGPVRRSAPVLAWLAPRLSSESPVSPGTVRLVGIVVHDPAFADPDAAARAAWIGDGSCPHQVMADHAGELDRYDVVVSVTWHDHGPEPVVVLVNP